MTVVVRRLVPKGSWLSGLQDFHLALDSDELELLSWPVTIVEE